MAEEKQTFSAKMTISSKVDGKVVKQSQNVELDPSFKGFKFYEQESGEPCLQVSVVQEGDISKRYLTFKKDDPKYTALIGMLPEGSYLDQGGMISVPLESVGLDASENLTIDVKTAKGNKTFLLGATGIKTAENEIVCKYEKIHDIHLGGDFLSYLSSTKKDGLTMHPQIVKLLQQCTKTGVEGLLNPDGTPFMDFQIVRIKSKGETYRRSELTGEKTVRASDFFLLKLKDAEGNLNFYISVGDRMVPLTGQFAPVIHCRENYGQAGKEIYDVGFNVTRVGMDPEAYGLNIKQVKQILELLEVATPEAINKCNTMEDFITNLKGKTGGMDAKNFAEVFKGGISAGQMNPIGGIHNLKAKDMMDGMVEVQPEPVDDPGDRKPDDDEDPVSDVLNGRGDGDGPGGKPGENPVENPGTGTGNGDNKKPDDKKNDKEEKRKEKELSLNLKSLGLNITKIAGLAFCILGVLAGIFLPGLALLTVFCGLTLTGVLATTTTTSMFDVVDAKNKMLTKKQIDKQKENEKTNKFNKIQNKISSLEKNKIKPLTAKYEKLYKKVEELEANVQKDIKVKGQEVLEFIKKNPTKENIELANTMLAQFGNKIVETKVVNEITVTDKNLEELKKKYPDREIKPGDKIPETTIKYDIQPTVEYTVVTEENLANIQRYNPNAQVGQKMKGVFLDETKFAEIIASDMFTSEKCPEELKKLAKEFGLIMKKNGYVLETKVLRESIRKKIDERTKSIQALIEKSAVYVEVRKKIKEVSKTKTKIEKLEKEKEDLEKKLSRVNIKEKEANKLRTKIKEIEQKIAEEQKKIEDLNAAIEKEVKEGLGQEVSAEEFDEEKLLEELEKDADEQVKGVEELEKEYVEEREHVVEKIDEFNKTEQQIRNPQQETLQEDTTRVVPGQGDNGRGNE